MTFHIRPAHPNESQAIANVFLSSWKTVMPDIPIGHTDEQVRTWIAGSVMADKRVFVATESDAVIAMMAISEDGEGGWIDHLYVAPEFVGRGVGSALLLHALGVLRAPVWLYTFQSNARARAFYEARGFRVVRFGDGTGNEVGLPDVLYRRD
jgi:ribosomal protein S18 acetylase RimI-like enzyme